MNRPLPFQGIRVVDFTAGWAGPLAAMMLGLLGADVIKVESIQRLDWWRTAATAGTADRAYEKTALFNSVNRNKREVTLNLKHVRGRYLFHRLVDISDIVIDNYSAHVLRGLGLGFDVLKQTNPGLIMVSAPAFGATGAWSGYPGFGTNVDEIAGHAGLTGYAGGPPEQFNVANLTDPLVGIHIAFAVALALRHRRKTGHGQFVDISHIEASTTFLGEAILDYTVNGRVWPRLGNRHPTMAPHGIYRCAGEDEWVAIAVGSDEEWRALCTVLGNEAPADDNRFVDGPGRLRHQDELDRIIEAWTRHRNHLEVQELLQQAGVAAGAVLSPREVLADPHYRSTGHFEQVERAFVGRHPYPALPMKFSRLDTSTRRAAPTLGEHNEQILRDLLGLSVQELEELERDNVIGTEALAAT